MRFLGSIPRAAKKKKKSIINLLAENFCKRVTYRKAKQHCPRNQLFIVLPTILQPLPIHKTISGLSDLGFKGDIFARVLQLQTAETDSQ